MEGYVDENITESFPLVIDEKVIKLESIIQAMVRMEDKRVMVSMFFNTVIEMIFQIAKKYPKLPLFFSGGVFQNRVLVEKIIKRCKIEERHCYFQNETAINDGGISLGQAWYALHLKTIL
jgi:hydrogenase maturation protein HypF